jgi:beta-glucosidase
MKLLILGLTLLCASGASAQLSFQNPDLPIEQRIDSILSLMTIEEKIAALSTNAGVPRLGIRGSGNTEGLHGVAQGGPSNWGQRNPAPTTQFPQAVGLAMSWDTALIRRAAAAEGMEARYLFQSRYDRSGIVVWAPNADLARDIRWGRTEESYGEDAYLAGALTVAFVKGLQGDHPTYWQAASLMKHFLANSNENNRTRSSSNFDERLLHEYYAVPFRKGVVEGGSRAYMAAYNSVNGVPMTVHPMLQELTVEQWGLDGIITTDGSALRLLISDHAYYPDLAAGAAAAIKAGINQFLDRHAEPVAQALEESLLTEADLDRVLRGRYRVLIRLGLLDPPERVPYARIGTTGDVEPWTTDAHRALARLVTQRSIVLLKNQGRALPLDADAVERIAVFGPWADTVHLDWYSGNPPYTVSPLDGIRSKLGARAAVSYVAGDDSAATVAAAVAADIAIVIVGNHPVCNAGWEECPLLSEGKEAVDRRSLQLEQEELIKRVYRANPNTVVVLISSFPYAITWTQHNVPAILHMTQNSQELGNALADALFGDINPGGRLVHTWVHSTDELPPILDYNLRNGRTYMYYDGEPLYPFGFGLSYTTFEYRNLRISAPEVKSDGEVVVSVDVTNTGERAGDEVVQLYVRHVRSAVQRPKKELKGFVRLTLQPGETRTASLVLKAAELAYWDADTDRWIVETQPVRLQIGASSADVRQEAAIEVVR